MAAGGGAAMLQRRALQQGGWKYPISNNECRISVETGAQQLVVIEANANIEF
jgi:hypothetical protein